LLSLTGFAGCRSSVSN